MQLIDILQRIKQFFYNVPNNLGNFLSDCKLADWVTDNSFEWQVLIVQDFWQVTKPENMSSDVIE